MNTQVVEIGSSLHQTLWANKTYGVRHNAEIDRYDTRSGVRKAADTLHFVCGEVQYGLNFLKNRAISWITGVRFGQFGDDTPIGTKESRALIVCLHGLNSHPVAFSDHVGYLGQRRDIDVYVPFIPQAGKGHLNSKETKKLAERITNWTKEHSGDPVALFAHSNGSRFAVRLETWLRKMAPRTPVHISLVAGVLFGSSHINKLTSWISPELLSKITLGFISPIACKELTYGSQLCKSLLRDARKPLPKNVRERDYCLYATCYDTLVPDRGSSLPILNKDAQQPRKTERHFLILNSGHHGAIRSVSKRQVDDCLSWMTRIQANNATS